MRRPLVSIATILSFAFVVLSTSSFAQQITKEQHLSHVRVVRISFIQGTVSVHSPGVNDWAKALVNSPVEQGFSIATAPNSFVEVQFENGSTVRMGELSRLDFTELALTPDGGKINHLDFEKGYATFHFVPEHHDDYQVKTADATLTPRGKAEFRTDFEQGKLRVEVFSGQVEVTGPHQTDRLAKDKVLTYNTSSTQVFNITDGIQKDAWDKWTTARDRQSALAYSDQSVNPGHSMYGWSDLGTYGDWAYYPGYGYGWAPYEPLGWSPYSTGMWGFYPNFGYTWISGEPWGWLPFHYGLWNFNPTFGWFWMPGFMGGGWSPALVNWYAGPGMIGWGPMGLGGTLPCSIGMAGCIVTSPAGTLLNGAPISSAGGAAPRGLKPIARPHLPVSPGLPGTRLPKGVIYPGGANGAIVASGGGPVSIRTLGRTNGLPKTLPADAPGLPRTASVTSRRSPVAASFRRSAAPSSILMGKRVSAASMLSHRSFFGRTFRGGREPAHVSLGNTLGGRFPTVAGRNGMLMPKPVPETERGIEERRGGGFGGNRSFPRASGPVALPHMSEPGAMHSSGGEPGFSRGSFGGDRSGGNAGISAPAASAAPISSGAHSSGGGGPTRH
jgi:Family of unknown function (DUF6600)/FecR protein